MKEVKICVIPISKYKPLYYLADIRDDYNNIVYRLHLLT